MTKHQVLIALCVGILIGVGIGSIYPAPVRAAYVLFSVALTAILLLQITHSQQLYRLFALLFCCIGLGVSIGFYRINTALAVPNQFMDWMGSKQDFEGLIVTEPDVRQDKQLLTVQPMGFSQRILVTTTRGTYFQYGDHVWVRGKTVEAAAFDDFDYPGYLARFNTYALARYPKVIVIESGKGNSIVGGLLRLKQFLVARLSGTYDVTSENLLLGILIGAKKGLDQNVIDAFNTTGTSHVLAASGFNISIFLTGLAYLAYVIGRRAQLVVSLVCILMFVVIAGPTASVVRATGMGLLVMLAIASGRLYNGLPMLLCIAAGMVVINPRILYWDVGFQLSVAATAGILIGMPLLARFRERFGDGYKIVELLGVTLTAIIATLPMSLWHFGRLSIVAPIANLLIVPVVPFAMALGGLSFLPYAGVGFGWINSYLLGYMLHVVEWLSHPSWASIDVAISGPTVLLLYAALVLLYLCVRKYLGHRRKTTTGL